MKSETMEELENQVHMRYEHLRWCALAGIYPFPQQNKRNRLVDKIERFIDQFDHFICHTKTGKAIGWTVLILDLIVYGVRG